MEKIIKEELLNKPGGVALSDDALEKVSGGGKAPVEGKKWADINTHPAIAAPAADISIYKCGGVKIKGTVQNRADKSADKSADDLKLT